MSLVVNLSPLGSTVSGDTFDYTQPLPHVPKPTSTPWSLANFLYSTDAVEAFFVGASVSAIITASSPGSDHLSLNTPASQDHEGSWGLDQFAAHNERIEDILMGSHDRSAAKAYHRTLLAWVDDMLTCLGATSDLPHNIPT